MTAAPEPSRSHASVARVLPFLVALSGAAVKLTRDYFGQRAEGLEPRFHGRDYPELGDQIDHTIWTRD